MTDENIDRKLHELMGRCWHEVRPARSSHYSTEGTICDKCGVGRLKNSGEPKLSNGGPSYSTSISDAMEAVDWVRKERGWGFRLATVKHRWSALFSSGVVEGHVICESREKAIVLALIEALEAK